MVAVREAADADVEAIHATCVAALTLDAVAAPALVDLLWTADVNRRRVALVADDGAGVVFASTGRAAAPDSSLAGDDALDGPPAVGYVDMFAVHPHAQGHGLGRALVTAAEERLAGLGVGEVRFAGNPPGYAWPGIDVRYTPALCLAERLGYKRYQMALNMTVELSAGPSAGLSTDADVRRLAEVGVDVRTAPMGRRAEVVEFVRTHWNDSWAWEVEHSSGCHYAVRSGEPLGFAAWGARPTWFGPMGTAPTARGLGIGRVLLQRCLAEQRDAGHTRAEIGWVGPLRFYSRAVGARAERVFALYRRRLEVRAHV
ncbi:MAG TPA: GNAT family N-acetyltransferase [Jiangellaceae bacterium]